MNEPLSFSEFYDQTAPRMLARAVMLCRNRQDAEDAVQEAYAEAFKRWPQLGAYRSPEAWVYKIMKQRLFRAAKHWWTRRKLLMLPVPPAASAEETAEAHTVLRALDLLPERQRQVLVLYCLHGMTYNEIAQELGLKIGTVSASIANARRNLLGLTGQNEEVDPSSPLVRASRVAPGAIPDADELDTLAALLRATESWLTDSFATDRKTLERIRTAILRSAEGKEQAE